MKLLSTILLSNTLLACAVAPDASEPERTATSAVTATGTTIQILADQRPALVAFRDGPAAAWQYATRSSPTAYAAVVHGPYTVTVVCADDFSAFTLQLSQTLDDAHVLSGFCASNPVQHVASGRMVQPGQLSLGDGFDASSATNWTFGLFVPDGTYDLVAASADHLAIRRAISVSGDRTLAPVVDVVRQGQALQSVAFSAINAVPGELLGAVAYLETASTGLTRLYNGSLGGVTLAPDSALIASDTQSVSIRAQLGTTLRAQRRPFRIGGDPSATLPAPLVGAQWTTQPDSITLAWTSRPANVAMFSFVFGTSPDGQRFAELERDATPAYLAAVPVTSATLDVAIPGFQPAWRVDFTLPYSREMDFQNLDNGIVSTSWITEQVNPIAGLADGGTEPPPASRHARPHAQP